MGLRKVWVEVEGGRIARIFRNSKAAGISDGVIMECPKETAVGDIRKQVFDAANGECVYCGKFVPFDGDLYTRGHMHEEVHRGEGGEVSIYNSVWACYKCHKDQHPEKVLRFGDHGI